MGFFFSAIACPRLFFLNTSAFELVGLVIWCILLKRAVPPIDNHLRGHYRKNATRRAVGGQRPPIDLCICSLLSLRERERGKGKRPLRACVRAGMSEKDPEVWRSSHRCEFQWMGAKRAAAAKSSSKGGPMKGKRPALRGFNEFSAESVYNSTTRSHFAKPCKRPVDPMVRSRERSRTRAIPHSASDTLQPRNGTVNYVTNTKQDHSRLSTLQGGAGSSYRPQASGNRRGQSQSSLFPTINHQLESNNMYSTQSRSAHSHYASVRGDPSSEKRKTQRPQRSQSPWSMGNVPLEKSTMKSEYTLLLREKPLKCQKKQRGADRNSRQKMALSKAAGDAILPRTDYFKTTDYSTTKAQYQNFSRQRSTTKK